MALYDQVVDAVVTELQAITDIGQVYNRRRFLENEIDVKTAFKTTVGGTDVIRGWEVSRRRVAQTGGSFAEHVERTDTVEITGWHSLDDSAATERSFQQLVDEVLGNLASTNWDPNPLGVSAVYATLPPRVTVFDEVMFAGYLCHRVIIEFPVLVDWDVSGY